MLELALNADVIDDDMAMFVNLLGGRFLNDMHTLFKIKLGMGLEPIPSIKPSLSEET